MLLPRAFRIKPLRMVITLAAIVAFLLASAPVPANAVVLEDGDASSDTSTGSVVAGRSGWSFNRSERCLMRRINRVRRARGLRALDWDKQIGYVARRHSVAMASSRGVWHDGSLGQKVTRWRRLGQNTGRGGKCRYIFRSFMRSSSHRSNILGAWRHLGVGATWSGGRLYVQQVFESRLDPGNVYSYP